MTRTDPFPRDPLSDYPDPILEGLKAPVTSAMVAIYTDQLNWRPDGVYQLSNDDASRQWDWGHGMGRPESLSRLQAALALDPRLHVLIAHSLAKGPGVNPFGDEALAVLADEPAMVGILEKGKWK